MLAVINDLAWMHRNAEQVGNGLCVCKKHSIPITELKIQRSIYKFPTNTGPSSTPLVRHFFCEKCHPERKFIKIGEPIFDIEVMKYKETIKSASSIKDVTKPEKVSLSV